MKVRRRSLAIYNRKVIEFNGSVENLIEQLGPLNAKIGDSIQIAFNTQFASKLRNYEIVKSGFKILTTSQRNK
jgi:hypothetical protein